MMCRRHFFMGVVLMFYNMVYSEKRENIIKDGQMSAMQSAREFQEYLSTSVDAIELSAHTIDTMLDENTNEEILDYLLGQTAAITSSVFENTSGLYGYINGQFLDGLHLKTTYELIKVRKFLFYIKL